MIVMTIDSESNVEESVAHLETLLSPVGLTAFLTMYMGPQLAKRAKERFASEGDAAVGGKWLPLHPATREVWRPSQGYPSAPINHRSGELERWVTQSGWDAVPFPGGATLRFPGSTPTGELAKKVATAQKGKASPKTPARPVLGVNTTDLAIFAAGFAMAMSDGVDKL